MKPDVDGKTEAGAKPVNPVDYALILGILVLALWAGLQPVADAARPHADGLRAEAAITGSGLTPAGAGHLNTTVANH